MTRKAILCKTSEKHQYSDTHHQISIVSVPKINHIIKKHIKLGEHQAICLETNVNRFK